MSDRRTFLVQMGTLTVTASAAGSVTLEIVDRQTVVSVAPAVPVAPVVGFMLDQPYLDFTGRATPYVPPAGLRSAESLANSVEAAFHRGIWFSQDQSCT